MRRLALLALLLAAPAAAQERTESHEMLGRVGSRAALLQLHATGRADGSWRLTGDYLVLATLQPRYLEGERSKQLGVVFLKEGSTPILYGREPTATLQGTWNGGILRGTRYAPGGQERERFEFSANFPSMEGYSAAPRCELSDGGYRSSFAIALEGGRLKPGSLQWRSAIVPGGRGCAIGAQDRVAQMAFAGGLRFAVGKSCRLTLRDLGGLVRVLAEDCAEFCGAQAYFEPLLLDPRGGCRLLRPQPGQAR